MEQQLVEPLLLDSYSKLLFLELLVLRLTQCCSLLNSHIYDVGSQGVDDLVKEVTLRESLIFLANRVGEVLSELW